MDSGYWLWVIPLGSKNTSIGIVADPAVHPFETFNTYEKAVEWMKQNEPLAYKMLEPLGQGEGLLDFRDIEALCASYRKDLFNGSLGNYR